MRILFILEYYYPHIGGVETFFKSLTEQLEDNHHHVTIITNRYQNQLAAFEEHGNIRIIRKKYYNRYIFTFLAWISALKYARESDLIHTTSYNAAVPAWICSKLTGTKAIITFHERWGNLWYEIPWMSGLSRKLHYFFEWLITKFKFEKFVAVSDFTKDKLIEGGVDANRVMRIYNGIDYSQIQAVRQRDTSSEIFTFLFFGRVGYAKGVDLLIESFKMFLKNGGQAKLIMVLPSERTVLYNYVKKDIRHLEKQGHLELKSDLEYNNLQHLIAAVDAVVIPSYSEGFCFAAVETMSIGTPIISSGQGALSEVVCGQHITVTSFDESALAVAYENAVKGNWNHTEKKKFPLQETIDQYISLYQEILNREKEPVS